MARLAYRFAMASAKVTTASFEASSFPELAQKFGVRSVPHTVVNDEIAVVGAVPEATLMRAIEDALSPQRDAQ